LAAAAGTRPGIIALIGWRIQKSWKLALGIVLGLVFIINQGLWKETVETLVLVISAAFMSMLIGVPIGIWLAHRPRLYTYVQPILDLMQTMPTFVYLIPGPDPLRPRPCPGPAGHHHLRLAGADPADLSRHHVRSQANDRGGTRLRRIKTAASAERSNCRPPCRPSWQG
jgi:hypothetical protein